MPPRYGFDERCRAFAQRALYLFQGNDIADNDQFSVGNFNRRSEVHDDERTENNCEFYVIRFILLLVFNWNKRRNAVKIEIMLPNSQSSFPCRFLAKSRGIYEGKFIGFRVEGGSRDNSTVLVLGVSTPLPPLNFPPKTDTSAKLAPRNPRTGRGARGRQLDFYSCRFGSAGVRPQNDLVAADPLFALSGRPADRLSRGAWPKACARRPADPVLD